MSAYYNIRKPDSRIFSLGRIHPEGGRTEGKRLSKKDKNCVHIKRDAVPSVWHQYID